MVLLTHDIPRSGSYYHYDDDDDEDPLIRDTIIVNNCNGTSTCTTEGERVKTEYDYDFIVDDPDIHDDDADYGPVERPPTPPTPPQQQQSATTAAEKKSLARKLFRGVGKKVIRFSVRAKKRGNNKNSSKQKIKPGNAVKLEDTPPHSKASSTTDSLDPDCPSSAGVDTDEALLLLNHQFRYSETDEDEEDETTTTTTTDGNSKRFTIEIDSDKNQVKVLDEESTCLLQEEYYYYDPTTTNARQPHPKKSILHDLFRHSILRGRGGYEEKKDEEPSQQLGNFLTDIQYYQQRHQHEVEDDDSQDTEDWEEEKQPEGGPLQLIQRRIVPQQQQDDNNSRNSDNHTKIKSSLGDIEITVDSFNHVSEDALVLAHSLGRRNKQQHNTNNNLVTTQCNSADSLEVEEGIIAPFLAGFACGELGRCPQQPTSTPSILPTLSEDPPDDDLVPKHNLQQEPLAWLGSPVDTMDLDDDEEEEEEEEEEGQPRQQLEPDKMRSTRSLDDAGHVVEHVNIVGGVDSEELRSASFSSAPLRNLSFSSANRIDSFGSAREDIAKMQWHKQYLHLSVQRLLEEKLSKDNDEDKDETNKASDNADARNSEVDGEERSSVKETASQIEPLPPPPRERSRRRRSFFRQKERKGEEEEKKEEHNVVQREKKEKQHEGGNVDWNDNRFHDDFDDFDFEANFPNIEVDSIQFDEEKKEELAANDEGENPTREIPHEQSKGGGTAKSDVSVGYIVRDLDKFRVKHVSPQEIAAAKANPPPPPESPSRSRSGIPLLPPPPPPTGSSPARLLRQQRNDRYSVEMESVAGDSVEARKLGNKVLSEFASLVKKHSDFDQPKGPATAITDGTRLADTEKAETNEANITNSASKIMPIMAKPMLPLFDDAEGSVDSEEEDDDEGNKKEVEDSNQNQDDNFVVSAKERGLVHTRQFQQKPKWSFEHDSIFDGTDEMDVPVSTIAVEKKIPISTRSGYTFDLVDERRETIGGDDLPCDEIIITSSSTKTKKQVSFNLGDDLRSLASLTTAAHSGTTLLNDVLYGCVGREATRDIMKKVVKGLDRYIDTIEQSYEDDITSLDDEESDFSLLI
ncbi:expressed unknown protein [Seminavis robusta]|uniref:Uncharacterized protein n=1 Tax=Seminavis robusta TaxID=568900 RepID=A0A9N8DFY3_9STRA|nr:expressed unknown protein [Seminavis robusta]|eukprot:Sro72_g040090.1 n/a (1083) ;mRNA; r:118346-121685